MAILEAGKDAAQGTLVGDRGHLSRRRVLIAGFYPVGQGLGRKPASGVIGVAGGLALPVGDRGQKPPLVVVVGHGLAAGVDELCHLVPGVVTVLDSFIPGAGDAGKAV